MYALLTHLFYVIQPALRRIRAREYSMYKHYMNQLWLSDCEFDHIWKDHEIRFLTQYNTQFTHTLISRYGSKIAIQLLRSNNTHLLEIFMCKLSQFSNNHWDSNVILTHYLPYSMLSQFKFPITSSAAFLSHDPNTLQYIHKNYNNIQHDHFIEECEYNEWCQLIYKIGYENPFTSKYIMAYTDTTFINHAKSILNYHAIDISNIWIHALFIRILTLMLYPTEYHNEIHNEINSINIITSLSSNNLHFIRYMVGLCKEHFKDRNMSYIKLNI